MTQKSTKILKVLFNFTIYTYWVLQTLEGGIRSTVYTVAGLAKPIGHLNFVLKWGFNVGKYIIVGWQFLFQIIIILYS